MGLIVLLGTVEGLFYFVLPFHAATPTTVRSETQEQAPTTALSAAAVKPTELWRPADAVKNLLVWDFRDALHNDQVTDPDTLRELRDAIEPSIAGHLNDFLFYGPVSGNFLGEVPESHQQLYTAILNWVEAGRSHADGDLLLAVVRGSDGTRVFELQGGSGGIGVLKLAGARQDPILSAPEWSGQDETMRGLYIFALSNDGARKVAGISTVYDDDCASGSSQPVVVADRIFADVDAKGEFRLSSREHWSSPCSPEEHFTLVSKERRVLKMSWCVLRDRTASPVKSP